MPSAYRLNVRSVIEAWPVTLGSSAPRDCVIFAAACDVRSDATIPAVSGSCVRRAE